MFCDLDHERKKELGVSSAFSFSAKRNRTFSSRQDDDGLRNGRSLRATSFDRGMNLCDLPRLAFDGVAQNHGGDTTAPGEFRGSLQ